MILKLRDRTCSRLVVLPRSQLSTPVQSVVAGIDLEYDFLILLILETLDSVVLADDALYLQGGRTALIALPVFVASQMPIQLAVLL